MAADKSSLLPEAPPPRPARREAAIEAALRGFDGVEEPGRATRPARAAGGWEWAKRPQFKQLVTASLIAAIGLPAALLVIRDRQDVAPEEIAQSPVASSPAQPELEPGTAPTASVEAMEGAPSADTVTKAPPARAEANETVTADEAQFAEAPPVVAAAPPPPPPPPPPAAMAQEAVSEDSQVVVTGSRISRPSLSSASPVTVVGAERDVAERKAGEAARAPDFVLKDPAYRTFLTRLQSAVRGSDRQAVIQLIALPLRVNYASGAKSYRNARSVLDDYDRIFTPQVKQAILNQRFERLFGRDRGVMIGSGEVWFDHTCRTSQCSPPGPVRITAVNP